MKNLSVMLGLLLILSNVMLSNFLLQGNMRGSCSPTKTAEEHEYDEYEDDYGTESIGYSYVCIGLVLEKDTPPIPNGIDLLKSLLFVNSTIHLIPIGVFTRYTILIALYLNNSEVSNIHPGAFSGLGKLQQLYLDHNNLTKVSVGVYNLMANLKILNLAYNNIESIDEHAFLGNVALSNLYLNNNRIISIFLNNFQDLPLVTLDLSYNRIDYNISKFDFYVFPTTIQYLRLCGVGIQVFENLSHLSQLVELNTGNNSLTLLQNIDLDNLIYLNLSYNLISQLNSHSFIHLPVLKHLFLQNNLISNIPLGCFKNLDLLEVLNLSTNNISQIDINTFEGLYQLTNLDISNNNLTDIDESMFFLLDRLKTLNIDNNRLNEINIISLTKHLYNLKSIGLYNNPWKCIDFSTILIVLKKANITLQKSQERSNNKSNVTGCKFETSSSAMKINFQKLFENYFNRQEKRITNFVEELSQIHNKVNKNIDKYKDILTLLEVLNKKQSEFLVISNTHTVFIVVISIAMFATIVLLMVRYKIFRKNVVKVDNDTNEITFSEVEMR